MNAFGSILRRHPLKALLAIAGTAFMAVLVAGTVGNANFWSTPDQRGDRLLAAGRFADAARTYTNPDRIGLAQYRNGDFEAAARSFARVPGAEGAYNQANAWLMHGQYDRAILLYNRALSVRPDWKDAEDNRALAIARRDRIKAAATQDVQQEIGEKPDQVVFDQKGDNEKAKPIDLSDGKQMSDAELQATWLRNVRTTPGDFLRAKFAFQAQSQEKEVRP